MRYRLKITDEASELLMVAAQWYAQSSQSLEIATAWYDGFVNAIYSLEYNPWLGGIAPEDDLFDFELRELHYGSGRRSTHRALYRITGDVVEVLSIRHHAQRPLSSKDF